MAKYQKKVSVLNFDKLLPQWESGVIPMHAKNLPAGEIEAVLSGARLSENGAFLTVYYDVQIDEFQTNISEVYWLTQHKEPEITYANAFNYLRFLNSFIHDLTPDICKNPQELLEGFFGSPCLINVYANGNYRNAEFIRLL